MAQKIVVILEVEDDVIGEYLEHRLGEVAGVIKAEGIYEKME